MNVNHSTHAKVNFSNGGGSYVGVIIHSFLVLNSMMPHATLYSRPQHDMRINCVFSRYWLEPAMPHLVIKSLFKDYGNNIKVLKDVNLEAEIGEFVVLVGPSGCGKSTLLRMIAGLEEITSGDISIGGRVVNTLPPAERDIAMVFQDYALYPHMTVEENLAFGLKMRKMPKTEISDRISSASRMLEIEHLLARRPAQLSGGQRQRVAIGRAIVRKPSMFLFDEPLSNLDAKLRAQTRIELAALHKKVGNTAIYVTHDQVEAMTLGHRICVLNQGRVQQFGRPLELYNTPANTFVAGFIGNPSMNFIKGNLEIGEGHKIFRFGKNAVLDFTTSPTPTTSGEYVVGIRPEAFLVGAEGSSEGLLADLVIVEPHGHEVHIVAMIEDKQVIVRSTDTSLLSLAESPQTSFRLTVEAGKPHWFETNEDGNRIITR